ncbi:phosphate/phosphite/phosphonate ABC transporter substrate-binding protein [Dyadobacter sp. LJ53]|uniref:sensor histidine kinase n=1 Tax=Dyadobacter chenwenxiniae TaxID=2906456 RepID=UPI001F48434D|nr:phosphate/phosphite/phosphonate ABC transporter substrate-binding protein [Dyadobacter chenwenxiniae]MCF0051715.1 phosphate/phosphite/phosphonate ABC transporter substrate-binding protein [Dyadobacter chenwenxiniae]
MHILSPKTFCLLLTFVCQFTVIVAGPDTLRITGSSYFDESKTLVLSNYISSQLKVPVKYENIPSTKRMHEALRSGKVDLALMNTFQYVFAKSDRINNIEPFMILGDSSGKAKTYLSCLIVRPNSPYRSLDQLVKESSKIRLDFAYVASTSGHIVPRMELANLGMQYPEAQFENVHFSGGHLEAIKAVIENRSDAAFVAVDDLVNYQLQGLISKDAVKLIWTSYPIMQSPVVIRQDLPETVKQKLRVLFLNLHINNPGVWSHIRKNWGAVRPARFVEAHSDDFLSVQKAADKVGKLVYFLNYYEERIAQQSQQLTNGEKLIEGQNAKIQQQKKVLEQQILQIKTQTVSLYLLGLLVLGIAGIIIVIIKASRSKQRLNEQLTGKNNQLEQTLFDLKVTQDKLVHSEKMASLGLLTAGIAHEINNPVNFIFTGINGLEKNINALLTVVEELEKLEDIPADDAQHQRETVALVKQQKRYAIVKASLSEFIDGIRLGAKRTADIVSGLRNFARTDQSERTMAHVHDCLNSALILLNFKIKEAKIQVVKDYDASIPEMACYPGPLNQVFMNLFTNALHAIQARTDLEGGQIKIETKQLAQTVKITISDNGIGIVMDIRDKIFDPFFTTKDVGEGTGLGLSITYGIIQKHQGSIEVESNVGTGTTFLIQLPTNLTMA